MISIPAVPGTLRRHFSILARGREKPQSRTRASFLSPTLTDKAQQSQGRSSQEGSEVPPPLRNLPRGAVHPEAAAPPRPTSAPQTSSSCHPHSRDGASPATLLCSPRPSSRGCSRSVASVLIQAPRARDAPSREAGLPWAREWQGRDTPGLGCDSTAGSQSSACPEPQCQPGHREATNKAEMRWREQIQLGK